MNMTRAMVIACWVIVTAYLIHTLNAVWIEPTYLGFENPATDYADLEKIGDALGSLPWVASGIGHLATGFAFAVLGVGLFHRHREAQPVASTLLLLAAGLACLGFGFGGIIDIPIGSVRELLSEHNPEFATELVLIASFLRVAVNVFAIIALSCFAGTMAWVANATGAYPKGFVRLGWANVLPGAVAIVFPLAGYLYLMLAPAWFIWLARRLGADPA